MSESIFIFLLYYVAGLLLAIWGFHREQFWHRSVGYHGRYTVALAFALNLAWPMVAAALFLGAFQEHGSGEVEGIYYGD